MVRRKVEIDSSFRELYEHRFQEVFRAAYLLSGNRAIAEDATQEAFARALERWERLRGKSWLVGWLTTTALNEARRSLKRHVESADVELMRADTDGLLDLERALRSLSPRQQEAVALHYILDMPVEDVALTMGCESGTVKSHLARARNHLVELLER